MLEGDAEERHQDRLGGHEQGNVRVCPNVRSRWVAKEYNTGARPDLFSATSPLEGVKLVISEAASSNQKGTVLLEIGDRKAYFCAKARRRVYIELPKGDGGGPGSRQCGLLRKSLCVTRDAAQNWECEFGGFSEEIGLRRRQASTCLCSEEARESVLQSMVMMSLSRLRGKTLSG